MGDLGVDTCWKCHEPIPDHFQMNSLEMMLVRPPIAGDLSMCGACGAFSEFDDLGHIHKPSLERMKEIVNTPQLMDMQARLVKRDGM
jgi:hypothetical protein